MTGHNLLFHDSQRVQAGAAAVRFCAAAMTSSYTPRHSRQLRPRDPGSTRGVWRDKQGGSKDAVWMLMFTIWLSNQVLTNITDPPFRSRPKTFSKCPNQSHSAFARLQHGERHAVVRHGSTARWRARRGPLESWTSSCRRTDPD